MFGLPKKTFIALLSLSRPLATKYISLNNQLSLARTTSAYFNSDKLRHHLFKITQIDLKEVVILSMTYLVDKAEHLYLNEYNMITGIND